MDKYHFPNGWTCISCGDEYLNDIHGKSISDYKEGTLCHKCFDDVEERRERKISIQRVDAQVRR